MRRTDGASGERARHPVRVLLCDDGEVVREGLRALLTRHGNLEIVGEAATATQAVDAVVRVAPAVVVIDVGLPGGSGIEVCRVIRQILPATKVVMLTHYPDDEGLSASIIAGASGYLSKATTTRALAAAIESVAEGGTVIDFELATRALDHLRHARAQDGR